MRCIHSPALLAIVAVVAASMHGARAQDSSESEVRAVVSRFFGAYAARDGAVIKALWSPRAPDYPARADALTKRLSALSRVEVVSVDVREIKIQEKEARVRIAAEMRAEERSTGKAAQGFGRMNRILVLAREADGWKVWRYVPAEEEVAEAVAAASGESQRMAVAQQDPDLFNPELVKALNTRGFRMTQGGQYRGALDLHMLAERIARQIGDTHGAADSLKRQGDVYAEQRELAEALAILEKCRAIFEAEGNEADVADVLNSLAAVQYRRGDKAKALETFQEAMRRAEAAGDSYTVASALNNIGIIQGDLGRHAEAIRAYERSGQIYASLGERFNAALMVHNTAVQHSDAGQYGRALELFPKALAEFRAMGNRLWTGVCLRAIGTAYAKQDRFPEAIRWYEESLALLDREEDRVQLSSTLFNLAQMHGRLGDSKRAAELSERCYRLRESLGDRAGAASALRHMAEMEFALSSFQSALELARRAVDLSASGPVGDRIRALNTLGAVSLYAGDTVRALEALHQALQLLEESGQAETRVEVLNNLGAVYGNLGDRAQEEKLVRDALQILAERGKDPSGVLLNLAGVLLNSGRESEAAGMLERIASRPGQEGGADHITAYAVRALGDIRMAHRDYAGALALFRRAQSIAERCGDRNTIAASLISQSRAQRKLRAFAEALQATTRARAVSDSTGATDAEDWTELGHVLRGLGRPKEALAAYEKAVALTEQMRARFTLGEEVQQRYLERRLEPYHGLIALHVAAGQPEQAFRVMERIKGRVLLDVLRGGRIPAPSTLRPAQLQREQQLHAELTSLNAQVRREMERQHPDEVRLAELRTRQAEARRAWDTFRTGLYAAHPELRVIRAEIPAATPAEGAAALPGPRAAALAYAVGEEQTWLVVLRPGRAGRSPGLKVLALPVGREALARRVEAFRQQLANPSRELPAEGRALHDLLVQPAARELAGVDRLIVSPDGPLWDLPFQALQRPSGRHLLEDFALSMAPSLTVLREMRRDGRVRIASAAETFRSPEPAVPLLAVGDPVIGEAAVRRTGLIRRGGRMGRLPESAREARALGTLYGAASRVYVGEKATEARVRAEARDARVLHFATHGMLINSSPLYSHILLTPSPGSGDDGILEAWEIMQTPLHAQVAVLSACETARGRAAAGEGVVGLTWALFVAGCRTAVVSQWEVESRSTGQLMVEFHRRLRQAMARPGGHSNAAAALRGAALAVRKDPRFRHAFFWAGFTVMGEGD